MVLEGFFLNIGGLLALTLLIPFLLLYLIKPKPVHESIPSLLFFLKDTGKSNVNSFFRSWLRDMLFLIQLLTFLFLLLAVAKPYIDVPRTYLVDQTVILLDTSGSMHAPGRFDAAVTAALERTGKENTLILIKEAPDVVLERVGAGQIEDYLETLEPTETTTPLTDAFVLAQKYAAPGTHITVISDFLASSGDLEYQPVADALEATGSTLEFVHVGETTDNVGIVDLLVGPTNSRVWVKNFNDRPAQVTLKISEGEQELVLAKRETQEITFNTPSGVAEISIEENDGYVEDNTVWTSAPEKNNIKMLVITNDRQAFERSRFVTALNVISKNFPTEFTIEYGVPPKLPSLEHDVYVISNVNPEFILPGYIKDIDEQVEQGAGVIVFPQDNLFSLDFQGMLPVNYVEDNQGGRASIVPQGLPSVTQDIQFGQVGSYQRVAAAEDAIIVATTEQDPIVVLRRQGRGTVLYFGIGMASAFSQDPSYPVFWRRMFDVLADRPSLNNLNVRTGGVLALPTNTRIETPEGTITTSLLSVEHSGLYRLPDRTIAANMLSDRESNVVATANITRHDQEEGDETTDTAPKELTEHFLWAAIAFLFIELLYIKFRGDF